ncbi:transmembrane-type terpene cyclase [Flavobacterium taihuense]|uniref:Uncharacterized protein n=1 Tax=Flavobacterium taihuense TaxID=2857508 RepID=A0ABS6XQD1_9FLAO|nr:hypothetical protein [Flavobacterium taihuense]MBW4358895.1 hypothetical protein [Flavobacterium taihuense]
MKYITILLGVIGGFSWIVAYILIICKGVKDKTYGMPLIPLVLNFGYEFVYSFCYPSNLFFNFVWFLLDIGIVYTYFKYGYKSFNKFYSVEKKEWYFISVFAFLMGFLINFLGYQFFSQNLNNIPDGQINIFLAYIWLLFISVCMLVMFFQRRNSDGQSFIIVCLMLSGNFSYFLQISFCPVFNHCVSPFLLLIMLLSIVVEIYYARLIFKQLIKEKKNPYSIF